MYNVTDGGFHQHYGRNNTVRNNIFAFSQQEQVRGTAQQKAGDLLARPPQRANSIQPGTHQITDRLVPGIRKLVAGAVGEMMLGRPPCRVVGRVDADVARDIDELADPRRPDLAVAHDVGIIAHLAFGDAAAPVHLGVAAEGAVAHVGGLVDERFDHTDSSRSFVGGERLSG